MTSSNARQQVADNLARVQSQIADAALRASRDPSAVTLVAVCKYVGTTETGALIEAGCRDLGESRPQQLWDKAASLSSSNIRWHLVGHLQRNKVRRTLPVASLIHSVDNVRLLNAIDHTADELGSAVRVLLEVNCSGEGEKHGMTPSETQNVLEAAASLPHVAVTGLMTMAPRAGGPSAARQAFSKLRELRDKMQPNCPPNVALTELSMGMSGDFREGISEGATLVRIGSALFRGVS
jgi:pyridoxal phosphate enzyme (YggS family)